MMMQKEPSRFLNHLVLHASPIAEKADGAPPGDSVLT